MNSSPFRSDALSGKRILVTGGGTGLGLEMARHFVSHGAVVHICGRREEVLRSAVADLRTRAARGADAAYHVCDVREADQVDTMIGRIFDEAPLTGLVNNAAANFLAPSTDVSPRGFAAIRSTVMDGAVNATLGCGRRWIAGGFAGSVVSMLVTWVWTGTPFALPSAMSKSAVHAMTLSLAVEWAPHRIRVNAVSPGPFPVESTWEKLAPIPEAQSGATSAESVPMRRHGRTEELCNLVSFLQADGCEYLTGQNIAIDGGQHLAAPSTFASLAELTRADWARAKAAVRARTEQEKTQRTTG